jgi:hypothetical protein
MDKKKKVGIKETDKSENIRMGYQTAIEMWAHCGNEVWSRFNVMVVSHSIIIAVTGAAFLKKNPSMVLAFVLASAGLILCILWVIMMERAFAYQNYYLFSARKFEESEAVAPVKIISKGKDFSTIDELLGINKGCLLSPIRRWLHRTINAQKASYLVISMFGIIYIFFLIKVFI